MGQDELADQKDNNRAKESVRIGNAAQNEFNGTPIADNSTTSESNATVSPVPAWNSRVILLALCLAFHNMVWALCNNSILVMLDVLAESLHITENNLQWVFNSTQLPFVSRAFPNKQLPKLYLF